MLFQATERQFSVVFLTAPGGSGKSYGMVYHLVHQVLPETKRVIYTNLPLKVEEICAFVAKRTGRPAEEFAARLRIIDAQTWHRWRAGRGGPWDLETSKGKDGENHVPEAEAEFWGDECHEICPASNHKAHLAYEKWIGTVRHAGWARLFFITQDPAKVGKAITEHAHCRYDMVDSQTYRDPFFKIPLADWYELRASLTRRYRVRVWVRELRKVATTWMVAHVESFVRRPDLFDLYRSHNYGVKKLYEFEKRSIPGVWWWFVRSNPVQSAIFAFVLWVICWVQWHGGFGALVGHFVEAFDQAYRSQRGLALTGPAVAVKVPGPVLNSRRMMTLGEQRAQVLTDQAASASVPPEERVKVLADQNSQLVRDLNDAKGELEKAKQEHDAAAAERDVLKAEEEKRSALVMVWQSGILFADGQSVSTGEVVGDGLFKGKKLVSVDFRKRRGVLDDGTVLRLAAVPVLPRVQKGSSDKAGDSGVSEPVPAVGGEGHHHGGAGGGGAPAQPVGQRPASRLVPSVAGGSGGVLNSGGGSVGLQTDQFGGSGPNGIGYSGGSGSPSWGASDPNGNAVLFGNLAPGGSGGASPAGAPIIIR